MLGKADDAIHTAFGAIHRHFLNERYTKSNPKAYAEFNNVAVFGKAVVNRDAVHLGTVRNLVDGLRQFPGITDFLLEASPREREQAVALVTVASRVIEPSIIRDWERGECRISNDALATLIMEYPDKAEQIALIVSERQTDDPEWIRSVINADTPILAEGIL